MRKVVGVFAAASLFSPAVVQAQATLSRQDIYNAAQTALDSGDMKAAAAGFVQLLPTDPAQPLSKSMAVIASRYGDALVSLERVDEGEAWIDRALPALPAEDKGTLAMAWMAKATAGRMRYDFTGALKALDEADALAAASDSIDLLTNIRINEAEIGATVDPAKVKVRLAELAANPAFIKHADAALRGRIEDLQARAAINLGEKSEAFALSEKAVNDSGGLTTANVTTVQVAIRDDAGVIARLNNNNELVRKYFAYTGAGHIENIGWINNYAGDLPVCSDEIAPDDSAVIALAISDDGRVVGAIPVYATHPGQIGATFAHAVSGWRWEPSVVKGVKPFWRATLQLSVRCVTRPQPEALGRFVKADASEWLTARGTPVRTSALDRPLPKGDPRFAGPNGAVLRVIVEGGPNSAAEMETFWSTLDKAKAPSSLYALLISHWAGHAYQHTFGFTPSARMKADTYGVWIIRYRLQFPDDRAGQWLTLEQALALEDAGDFARAQPLLAKLGESNDLDPALHDVALLHNAISLDRTGRRSEAKASLEKSGLNEQKCSLFDTRPVSQGPEYGNYPEEALHWGFEGFAQEAFDIGDDGRVKNIRTVVAYPPYIFDQATERAVQNFHYLPPRLGDKAVGCESYRKAFNYRIAG